MRHSTRNLQHTVLEGKHKRRSRERRPAVEGLEERALLSAAHDLAVHKHVAVPVHDQKPANELRGNPWCRTSPRQWHADHDPSLVDPWDINFPQQPGIDSSECGSPTKVRA